MPTEYWYPVTAAVHNVTNDGFTNVGGANKNVSMQPEGGRSGPPTHDDATTRLSVSAVGPVRQDLNIDWPGPMAALGSPFVFTAYIRHRFAGGSVNATRAGQFINSAGTLSGSNFASVTNMDSAWADYGADISAGGGYRPGGGSWALADFASDQVMMPSLRHQSVGAANTSYFTSVWGQISYEPHGGFLTFFIWPLIGTLLFQGDLDRHFDWRQAHHPRGTILTAVEREQAWREYRAFTNPKHFDLGRI